MKRKRRKTKVKRNPAEEPRPWVISGGFDPECEMCRAMMGGGAEIFGDPLEVDGAEVREILDIERAQEMFRALQSGAEQWTGFSDEA